MQQVFDPIDIQKNKDMAAISYVWILSIAVFFAKPDSPFARFHARQGIALFLASIVAGMIPVLGKLLLILIFLGMVYGFIQAGRGLATPVPIVGDMLDGTFSVSVLKRHWSNLVRIVRRLFGKK